MAVHENPPRYLAGGRYDDEGSERSAIGSALVTADSRWTATLTVPLPGADAVFLRIERQGPLPEGYRGADESAGWSMPVGEIDVAMEALAGVIKQARRDGVLA